MNRIALLAGIALLGLVLLPLAAPGLGSWGGADGEGMAVVSEQQESYEPWFDPVFEPPSGEIESLLFSIQAAIGGGIIGYALGANRST